MPNLYRSMESSWRRPRQARLCLALLAASATASAAGGPAVKLTPVIDGLKLPVDVVAVPDEPGALFVLEQNGRLVEAGTGGIKEVLRRGVSTGGELGLLGIALHPDFPKVPEVFLNYTVSTPGKGAGSGLHTRITRTRLTRAAGAWRDGPEQPVLEFGQPYSNHNGGQLAFGADRMLYIAVGDGGSGGDPHGNGQSRQTLLGKILRIDPLTAPPGTPYAIPPDNPYADAKGARPEIWILGLRNPWRFSFLDDRRLIVADVGQNRWEEISVLAKGDNAGWGTLEGRTCADSGKPCSRPDMVEPFWVYGRDQGSSITGGLIYRGRRHPSLRGLYLYGDYVSGRLWAIRLPGAGGTGGGGPIEISGAGRHWSAFGVDHDGEVLVCDHQGGTILRLD